MIFKEGDAVEVLRSEICEAWLPAKIVSVDRHKLLVRFDYRPQEIERVCAEDVRPCPPSLGKKVRWVLGDTAEVFDGHSWRAAKIVKVLHDNRFVVKVHSSILLKEFHGSNLRVRLAWHDDQWIGKDFGNKQINFKAAHGNEGTQAAYNCTQNEKKVFGGFSPIRDGKRNHTSVNIFGVHAVEGSAKKRKKSLERRQFQLLHRELPKQVHVSVPKVSLDKKCLHASDRHQMHNYPVKKFNIVSNGAHAMYPHVTPLQAIEERNECSIASCGSNYVLECTVQDSHVSSRAFADRSFNDASSSCPAKPRETVSDHGEEFAASVHKLELQAYQSTVQAFYASGPLSWEQESLLTNLRLSLNISNEEHLLQLRHLLSAPVL